MSGDSSSVGLGHCTASSAPVQRAYAPNVARYPGFPPGISVCACLTSRGIRAQGILLEYA